MFDSSAQAKKNTNRNKGFDRFIKFFFSKIVFSVHVGGPDQYWRGEISALLSELEVMVLCCILVWGSYTVMEIKGIASYPQTLGFTCNPAGIWQLDCCFFCISRVGESGKRESRMDRLVSKALMLKESKQFVTGEQPKQHWGNSNEEP